MKKNQHIKWAGLCLSAVLLMTGVSCAKQAHAANQKESALSTVLAESSNQHTKKTYPTDTKGKIIRPMLQPAVDPTLSFTKNDVGVIEAAIGDHFALANRAEDDSLNRQYSSLYRLKLCSARVLAIRPDRNDSKQIQALFWLGNRSVQQQKEDKKAYELSDFERQYAWAQCTNEQGAYRFLSYQTCSEAEVRAAFLELGGTEPLWSDHAELNLEDFRHDLQGTLYGLSQAHPDLKFPTVE